MDRKGVIALTLLSGIESAGAFGNMCPSRVEVETNAADPAFRQDLREAYVVAGVVSLGMAGIIAYLTESPWPLVSAGIGAAGWVYALESALPVEQRLSIAALGQPRPMD